MSLRNKVFVLLLFSALLGLLLAGCKTSDDYTPPPATEVGPDSTAAPSTADPTAVPQASAPAATVDPTTIVIPSATPLPEGYPGPVTPVATMVPEAYPSP